MPRAMNREEFVEFASFLFGPKWQTPMAKELGIDRQTLVRTLASGQAVPEATAKTVLALVDGRISQVLKEQTEWIERIEKLKREMDLTEPDPTKQTSGEHEPDS